MPPGERLNTLTHLAGTVLALGASVPLLARATERGGGALASAAVYALSLLLMYGCSSLYHGSAGRLRELVQRLDHISIYLLIAGSYTPFCVLLLSGREAWLLLTAVWTLALFGVLQELRTDRGARFLSLCIYLAMGWSAVSMLGPLRGGLGRAGFAWLVGGGLAYTFGVVFYVLDHRLRHAHGIWHLFVLLGSTAHFIAIYRYVL